MVNRIDYIHTMYETLVRAFGEAGQGDPHKIIAEWQLTTPHGWAEIYAYNEEVSKPEDVEEWHVQAETPEAFQWIREQFSAAQRQDDDVTSPGGREGN